MVRNDMFNSSLQGSSSIIGALLGILLGLLVIFAVISLVFYILGSLGLMKIASKNKINHGWFAWVPFLSTYLMGEIAFESKKKALIYFIANMVCAAAISVLTAISNSNGSTNFSWIFTLLVMVLNLIAYYKIYAKMSTKAVTMLVFTILTGSLLAPVFCFAIRNNDVVQK